MKNEITFMVSMLFVPSFTRSIYLSTIILHIYSLTKYKYKFISEMSEKLCTKPNNSRNV